MSPKNARGSKENPSRLRGLSLKLRTGRDTHTTHQKTTRSWSCLVPTRGQHPSTRKFLLSTSSFSPRDSGERRIRKREPSTHTPDPALYTDKTTKNSACTSRVCKYRAQGTLILMESLILPSMQKSFSFLRRKEGRERTKSPRELTCLGIASLLLTPVLLLLHIHHSMRHGLYIHPKKGSAPYEIQPPPHISACSLSASSPYRRVFLPPHPRRA